MVLIEQVRTTLEKNPNTKTTYNTVDVEKTLLTEKQYKLTTSKETISWFRRLGGSETAQRSYTCYGYVIHTLISTSPDRLTKSVREFNFYSFSYSDSKIFENLFKEYKDGLYYLKRFKRGMTIKEVQKVINDKVRSTI